MTPDHLLRIAIQDNLTRADGGFYLHDIARHAWMGLSGASISGFDTSRAAFLGTYGGYHQPQAVLQGNCTGSKAYGDNACGSLQSDLTLEPAETRELIILLGIGDARTVGIKTFKEFSSPQRCDEELARLKAHWHARLESLTVNTPDEDFNHTINVWGLYNSLISFAWSRSASLVYNGERDGLGFRDSVQDVLGVVAAIPEEARKRLELMLTGQVSSGGALPIVQPFDHKPGQTPAPAPEEYRSDDCLWFFNAIPAYVAESGDLDFYHKVLPYADRGEASVLSHLRRALEFNLERTGKNGLPCGLLADWNDCLKLGYYGESVFVAFQVRFGLGVYAEIATRLGKHDEAGWAIEQQAILDAVIQKHTWDGSWFIWAIAEDGTVYGTKQASEGSIYLNTQLWSVISGSATPQQEKQCLEAVKEKLATPHGLMLTAPPFVKASIDVMRAVVFNPGIKENAGIFNHTQGWGVMAECLAGNGDRAYQYLRASMPAAYNTRAELRQCEPYVQSQTTYASFTPRPGNSRTSWLTGAAAWSYFSATQYILGIKPTIDGLVLNPCIPSDWDSFSAIRKFRGKTYRITVHNPEHVNSGVVRTILNGKEITGNLIPAGLDDDEQLVEVWLGVRK